MSPGDEPTATGAEFRNAVNAEIEVLLQVWEEEMHQDDIDSRYRSPTCQRLSVFLRTIIPSQLSVTLQNKRPAG